MKNILILTIFACLATSTSFAQSKGSLHLSLGGALPIGEFGSKDPQSATSGMAKLGGLAEIGYSHPLKDPHWGLSINIRGRLNALDGDAETSTFRQTYPEWEWSTSNSHYKTLAALVGVYYNLPVLKKDGKSSKFDVRFELQLGAAKCIIPDYTLLGLYDTAHTGATGYIQAKVNHTSVITFTGVAKAGIAYHLNKKLDLLANLDFWYAKADFKHLTQTIISVPQLIVPGVITPENGQNVQYYQQTSPYKQSMNTLNLSVGIAVSL